MARSRRSWNVNSRYTVESVNLNPRREYRLSDPVLGEMRRLIGARLDVEALDGLARRITEELRAQRVTFHVSRGNEREHVQVTFDVERRDGKFDVSLSGLTYNSREGWTGVGQASLTSGLNAFTVAGLSNGDDLVERYSGVRTRYDRLNVGTPKVKLSFEVDSFREQWDPQTQAGSGAYRSRLNFEPSATFALAKPVTMTVGLSFESMSPELPAARAKQPTPW